MSTEALNPPVLSVLQAVKLSLMGAVLVFIILVALMYVFQYLHVALESIAADHARRAKDALPAAPVGVPARGSMGEVSLYDVDDRTAVMVMAVVASEMGVPLNELRFISIRERK